MLPEKRIESLSKFWPYYVMEHSKSGTRMLHFIGTTLALGCLIQFFLTFEGKFILYGLFVGYLFAWIGHFAIEKNRPATFKYPLWSFLCDWRMWFCMLTLKMTRELEKSRKSVS